MCVREQDCPSPTKHNVFRFEGNAGNYFGYARV